MKRDWKQVTIGALFVSVVAAFFHFGLHHYLTIESIRVWHHDAVAAYDRDPIWVYLCFIAAFSAVNFACFMGTWVIMIGAGAIFGVWLGALAVGLAYSIGGTLHLLLGRFLFRDFVARRWADKLEKLNREMEQDGLLVLFGLRMMSIIPYPTINFTMALTPIRVVPFFVVTLVADTIIGAVYANTGTQIANIKSVSDVASISLFASLAALGVLPLLMKAFLTHRREARR
ncbi:MAG: VTT domain-containing protein [Bdellovibrionota bacterium]